MNNEIVTFSDFKFQEENDAKIIQEITNVDEIIIPHVRSETNPTCMYKYIIDLFFIILY